MIDWFTWVLIGTSVVAGLLCVVMGLVGAKPNDVSVGAIVLVELLLIAQAVIAIIAPLAGNPPTGSLVEVWIYLIAAIAIPPLATFWALVERSRWSTVVLGVAALAIAVMVYRMNVIWTVQLA